jgi:hypothetical protein
MKNEAPRPKTPHDRLKTWIALILDATTEEWQEKIIDTFKGEKLNALDLNTKISAIAEATGAQQVEVSTVTRITGISLGDRPHAQSITNCGYLTYRDSRQFAIVKKIAAALECSAEVSPDERNVLELRSARNFKTIGTECRKGA